MSDLFWPGDDRAADLFSSPSFLAAMVEVEEAWLGALGVASPGLKGLVGAEDEAALAREAESGGNPVIGLVALLRQRLGDSEAGRLLHRGLTSQDVVDSALMLLLRDAVAAVVADLRSQTEALAALATEHRDTPMVARTLTQHAVPTTFGLKVATWLTGVLDAYDDLVAVTFPVQLGGAAGTLAAVVELGHDVDDVRIRFAGALGLAPAGPWHTSRRPVTRAGDALVACTDAWGRIAQDVLTLGRPEIGELAEGSAGGSSTMPHKANPVLSVLVRRAALAAPHLGATLHAAAADQADERAAGGWHVEWETLRRLARQTVVAASEVTELTGRLEVHADRMAATLDGAHHDVRSEQRTMADLAGHAPGGDYLGAAGRLVDAVVERARATTKEHR